MAMADKECTVMATEGGIASIVRDKNTLGRALYDYIASLQSADVVYTNLKDLCSILPPVVISQDGKREIHVSFHNC